MLRTLTLLGIAALVATASADDRRDPPVKAGHNKLLGTYTITKGERNGKAIPAEEIKGSVVIFTQNKVVGTDKDKKEFFAATYTVDTTTEPWAIKMTSTTQKKGLQASGVVKVDGDTVTICYALPGGKTPASFSAKEKQQCFVLKRVKTKAGR